MVRAGKFARWWRLRGSWLVASWFVSAMRWRSEAGNGHVGSGAPGTRRNGRLLLPREHTHTLWTRSAPTRPPFLQMKKTARARVADASSGASARNRDAVGTVSRGGLANLGVESSRGKNFLLCPAVSSNKSEACCRFTCHDTIVSLFFSTSAQTIEARGGEEATR
jgi:hypothetical protein